MSIDRAVMAFAGFMVLLSLALSEVWSPYWLLLTAFVGLNLLQAPFTGFCPAAIVFRRTRRRTRRGFQIGSGVALHACLICRLLRARKGMAALARTTIPREAILIGVLTAHLGPSH